MVGPLLLQKQCIFCYFPQYIIVQILETQERYKTKLQLSI